MLENYGIISLVPIFVVVTASIITKRVLEPLILGTLAGYVLLSGLSFFPDWVGGIFDTLADPDTVWTMLAPALFGALIMLFDRSNAALAFRNISLKYVKSERGSLLATFIFGVIIFIDEYMNALLVGGTMRNLTDKFKVPRPVLAFITNTTGTPVSVLTPFSSWTVFLMGVYAANGITHNGSTLAAYLKTIPFIVYAFVSLAIVLLFVFRKIPMTKYVKIAYERAQAGDVFPEGIDHKQDSFDDEVATSAISPKIINFVLPLVMLVLGTWLFDMDLIIGVIIAIATCFVLFLVNRTMTYQQLFDSFINGVQEMVFLIIFVMFLFLLVRVNENLGTIEYVIMTVQPYMHGVLLPAITLLVVAFLSFTTGSFWGTMAIAIPIVVPLAEYGNVNIFLTLGALVSGAVFGSHVCFFGDAVTLTSTSTQIRNVDQVRVTFPYALSGLFLSFVIYIVLGFIF